MVMFGLSLSLRERATMQCNFDNLTNIDLTMKNLLCDPATLVALFRQIVCLYEHLSEQFQLRERFETLNTSIQGKLLTPYFHSTYFISTTALRTVQVVV